MPPTRRLHTVAGHLHAAPSAEKSVSSPVLASLGAVERYKYVTGKEPLIQVSPRVVAPLSALSTPLLVSPPPPPFPP
eukprot:COSAG03_NODE_18746_length_349_cov_1.004000_1_plen_76_part_01